MKFSDYITEKIKNHPNITVIEEEVTEFPEGNTIIATGPLTSDSFAEVIYSKLGLSFNRVLINSDTTLPILSSVKVPLGCPN